MAYTFDAGSNACLYTLESNLNEIIGLIKQVFPTNIPDEEYLKGINIDTIPIKEVSNCCKISFK